VKNNQKKNLSPIPQKRVILANYIAVNILNENLDFLDEYDILENFGTIDFLLAVVKCQI